MKHQTVLFVGLLVFSAAFLQAQTVVITPRKTTFRRPKPQSDYKRTFTVRRPIAKAATPALSSKITAAISPEKVLDFKIKDEMTEYQWLEEADYKVLFNNQGVLCIEEWMSGTAAYPDSVTKRVVVDIATGNAVRPDDVLSNLTGLSKLVRKAQIAEIAAATKEIKKEDPEADPKELFSEANFTVEDFRDFSVGPKGVTFYYDYGFPHAIEALQPAGEFHFSWAQLKPYVRTDRLLARFVR